MRPRLLHLGYGAAAVAALVIAAGFNEAEAFTPRIPTSSIWRSGIGPCFNEAEAFTPRIPPFPPLSSICLSGFNEAEAFTPRIQDIAEIPPHEEWELQ